jgi:hypothetical protein
VAAYRGDFSAARAHYEEALLQRGRESGNELDALLAHGLGAVLVGQGELEAGLALLEQSLVQCRARGEKRGVAMALLSLSYAAARAGVASARFTLQESRELFRELGESMGVIVCSLLLGTALPDGMLAEIGEPAVHASTRCSAPLNSSANDVLWTLLEVLPADLARLLRLELIVERFRIVIVDQHEGLTRSQLVERVEDERVPVAWVSSVAPCYLGSSRGRCWSRRPRTFASRGCRAATSCSSRPRQRPASTCWRRGASR